MKYRIIREYEVVDPPEWLVDLVRDGDESGIKEFLDSSWRYEKGMTVELVRAP